MSYLTNRQQYVRVDDLESSSLPVHFGVPQGSILGPVLFMRQIYHHVFKLAQSNYADDTTLYKSTPTSGSEAAIRSLQNDISELCSLMTN